MEKKNRKPKNQKPAKSEIKLLQEKQERSELLFNTEALIKKPDIDKEIEMFELRNGTKITYKHVTELLFPGIADYDPMFPNSNSFFKLVFKLNGWTGDPTSFVKPSICALYIKKYIYARFKGDILPYLYKRDNPLINGCGYIRRYKLFQFLNDEGRTLMAGFINDMIEVMESSENWYDFELKYTKKYELSVQLKLIIE